MAVCVGCGAPDTTPIESIPSSSSGSGSTVDVPAGLSVSKPHEALSSFLIASFNGDFGKAYTFLSASDKAAQSADEWEPDFLTNDAILLDGFDKEILDEPVLQATWEMRETKMITDTEAYVAISQTRPDFETIAEEFLEPIFDNALTETFEEENDPEKLCEVITEMLVDELEKGTVPKVEERLIFDLLKEDDEWRVRLGIGELTISGTDNITLNQPIEVAGLTLTFTRLQHGLKRTDGKNIPMYRLTYLIANTTDAPIPPVNFRYEFIDGHGMIHTTDGKNYTGDGIGEEDILPVYEAFKRVYFRGKANKLRGDFAIYMSNGAQELKLPVNLKTLERTRLMRKDDEMEPPKE